MKKIHLVLFFISFILISIIEGIHFILDLRFLMYFLYCLPLFLILLDTKKGYKVPAPLLAIMGLYLVSSLVSTLYSREIGTSLELFFKELSLCLILVYCHAHSDEIEGYLPKIVVWLSMLFIIVSCILFMFPAGRLFILGQRLNLLYNPAYLHKTIGDFLTLGIIITSYLVIIKKERLYLFPLLVFIPIFLVAFSRTAYIVLTLIIPLFFFINKIKFKKISPLLTSSLIINIFLIILLFLTLTSHTGITILSSLQEQLKSLLNINVRGLIGSHSPFWIEGIKGFLLAPLTGNGWGTFEYISYRFTEASFLTSFTSFNIIIDLLAERGIIPLLSFLLLILYVLMGANKKKVLFLIFLALIIGFMGYSTYKYLQIYLLFFILMGLLIPKQTTDVIIKRKYVLALSLIAVIFINTVFVHTVLIRMGKYELAHVIYPYDRDNMKVIIRESLLKPLNNKQTVRYLGQYLDYFGANAYDLEFAGDIYNEMGLKYRLNAIHAYEQSFVWGKYGYGGSIIVRMQKLYELKQQVQGHYYADKYVIEFMGLYSDILKKDPKVIQNDIYHSLEKTYFSK